jgi:hypothetical protein
MKSFRAFITETVKFHVDNPGGRWLQNKQEDAESRYRDHGHKVSGPITGYFADKIKLKTEHLTELPGSKGEHSYRGHSFKMHELEREIGHPSKFNSEKNPILIGVNHRGEPHILEGNHRVAYAAKHGIPHVHAEVKYYAGGEGVNSKWHPSKVEKMKAE